MIKFDKNFRNATPSEIIENYPKEFKWHIYLCFKSLITDELSIRQYYTQDVITDKLKPINSKLVLTYGAECSCYCARPNLYETTGETLLELLNSVEGKNDNIKQYILNSNIWDLCEHYKCSEYEKFIKNEYTNNIKNYHDISTSPEFIEYKNIIDDIFVNFLERKDVNNLPKHNLKFTIGSACNYKCLSCRNKLFTNDLTLKNSDIYLLINFINKYKMLTVGCMGEFFFKDNYLQIFKNKINCDSMVLFTNASLFNETNWNRLHDHNKSIIKSIIISLDAATEETYSNVRSPLWKTVMKNLEFIKELQKTYKFELISNYTISKYNMHEIIPFADKFINTFDKITYDYARPNFNEIVFDGVITDNKTRNEIDLILKDLAKQYPLKINP